jgi:hypothetical protein
MKPLIFLWPIAWCACGPAFTTGEQTTALERGDAAIDAPDADLLESSVDALAVVDAPAIAIAVDAPNIAVDASVDAGVAVAIDAAIDAASDDGGCSPLPASAYCSDLPNIPGIYAIDNAGDPAACVTLPKACQCAETFTCACIVANAASDEPCRFAGSTVKGCTMQANGAPKVSCQ